MTSKSFETVYEENKDIYVSYSYFIKHTIKDILAKNETTIDKMINYILHEDDYHLIEYKFNMYRWSFKYKESKTEVVNLATKYFNDYRNKLYKESKTYQRKRFNMRYDRGKLEYCKLNEYQVDDKYNIIFIPTNAYYLIQVLDYIVKYYCTERFIYKREVSEIPYHKIKIK